MKTRLLIIIVILAIIIASVITYGFFTLESESELKPLLCGKNFIQRYGECHPDPQLLEPNTVLIYSVTGNYNTRLAIFPSTIIINLEENNTITWINQGLSKVTVSDLDRGLWGIDEIKPSMQKSIQFNNTGFYSFLVVTDMEGRQGRIVALDDDVNSLSVSNRIQMGKAIISSHLGEHPELVSVGGGSAEIGVHVTINKKELELHEDAKSYYHEKYRSMIPFDVPIIIEFGEPIEMD